MNPTPPSLPTRILAWALSLAIALPWPALAQVTDSPGGSAPAGGTPVPSFATDVSSGPLAQPATSVKPNMLLILDDSGSMARQYTPDYVTSNSNAGVARICLDALDNDNLINTTPIECWVGDPPAMTTDVNTQYYNPDIRYFPASNYDGSSKGDMNCTATGGSTASPVAGSACNASGWTAVPTDNVSSNNTFKRDMQTGFNTGGSQVNTYNIRTNFPDRAWCDSQSATNTDTTHCKTNSAYTYPEFTYGYGLSSGTLISGGSSGSQGSSPGNSGSGPDGSNVKFVFGAPYYYRILPSEYCNSAALKVCVSSSVPTTVAGVAYTFPAPVRFCDSAALTNCQAKRQNPFYFPKFLGTVQTAVAAVPVVPSAGKITLTTAKDSSPPIVLGISVTTPGGTTINLISSTITMSAGTDTQTGRCAASGTSCTGTSAAGRIVAAINANTSAGLNHGYSASVTASTASITDITITAPAPGGIAVPANGTTISVNAPAGTPKTRASLTTTISGVGSSGKTTQILIGPVGSQVALLGGVVQCSTGAGCTTSYSPGGRNGWMTVNVAAMINANTSSGLAHGYTATANGSTGVLTITAPAGTGSELNTYAMSTTTTNTSYSGASLGGGITPNDLESLITNFSGGVNAVAASAAQRLNVGNFVRTNIVPGALYPRTPARTDCVTNSTTCTYDEEMTNFGNWFAYYRSRAQMAKTSIGRAFLSIGSDFRVGYMTINYNSSNFLAVNDFNTAAGQQKNNWYNKLYAANASGSTPLRGALARAGQYYGNQRGGGTGSIDNSMGASPIQLACQPSYAILTSDGYWNDSSGFLQLDGTTNVGNQDSQTVSGVVVEKPPYATLASGSFDKNAASNTLADVAMYYYQTDLRPDLSDQVPPSGIDLAPNQHMTTFTVGMGLAGLLDYDPNYQQQLTAADGDFGAIRDGTKVWPTPSASAESTLDDLWHAAVNGRGKFFSAQDPVALANGIADTLNAVQARIGAGAAAATSNLQPVAGDNFAFTAQYQTVDWTGDLTARTIDLGSGTVATRQLWSASVQLDQRDFTSRRIYAFDAGDTSASATVTVSGASRTQNANKLRSFCWTDAPIASYAGCADGGLLTATEMSNFFDPMGGPNGQLYQSVPWPTDGSGRNVSATKSSLVDFLRGDSSNEDTGGTSASDLYRNRVHILGDIVNAQPAYVKASPFNYGTTTDPFYTAFKGTTDGTTATRKGTVFVAANDGMLHAFETDPDNQPYYQTGGITTAVTSDDTFTGTLNTDPATGEGAERWAFIPTVVFPSLKRLAEATYGTNHRYMTDGSPTIGDVCFGHTTSTPCSAAANWHTILVAGLNAGGRGYYALDITDPNNPVGLWEVSGGTGTSCIATDASVNGTQTQDCNIGMSFGNPIIAKRPGDGKWVVYFTSGHNNLNPGDGKGYLYEVDAQTGKILHRTGTGVGCQASNLTAPCTGSDDPSGLSRINAWVDSASTDNTALTIYGGDLKGNVWRFQLQATTTPYTLSAYTVTRLATVKDAANKAQPITTRPELGLVNTYRMVYFATGKFLGVTDKSTTQRQTIYAVKDPMNSQTSPIYATVRGNSAFVVQTLTSPAPGLGPDTRTASNNTVDLTTNAGWMVDLPDGGTTGSPSERVNVDPILQLGTLVVPSNVPTSDTCVAGGFGWINFLDYRSGSIVPGSSNSLASQKISASLVVGINVVQLPGGTVKTIVTTADNQQTTQNTPVAPATVTGRRISWRELFVE
jgi:type IV pilus assembly protein PilY1